MEWCVTFLCRLDDDWEPSASDAAGRAALQARDTARAELARLKDEERKAEVALQKAQFAFEQSRATIDAFVGSPTARAAFAALNPFRAAQIRERIGKDLNNGRAVLLNVRSAYSRSCEDADFKKEALKALRHASLKDEQWLDVFWPAADMARMKPDHFAYDKPSAGKADTDWRVCSGSVSPMDPDAVLRFDFSQWEFGDLGSVVQPHPVFKGHTTRYLPLTREFWPSAMLSAAQLRDVFKWLPEDVECFLAHTSSEDYQNDRRQRVDYRLARHRTIPNKTLVFFVLELLVPVPVPEEAARASCVMGTETETETETAVTCVE